ncbi:MAG: universal stress protein [Dehalococcoidia bacterium]
MYRKILVPLDGSELAEKVFTYAKEVAGRLDSDLVLLHVCKSDDAESLNMYRAYVERKAEIIQEQSRAVQSASGISSTEKPVDAYSSVEIGDAAEGILRYAETNDVDLILMATHGRTGMKRWLLGSVADKVLRATSVPVWLVRAGVPEEAIYDEWPRMTVLVPLDGSSLAERILPHVEAIAKQRGVDWIDVLLIRVVEEPFVTADYPQAKMKLSWEEHVEAMRERFRKDAREYLQDVESKLKEKGVKVASEVSMGKPADKIIEYADSSPFNLVAMSTHGHSGLVRTAWGSVADRVLREVKCPLLLVRAPESLI